MTSNSRDSNGTSEIELNFLLVGKKKNNNNNISIHIIVAIPYADQKRIIVIVMLLSCVFGDI